MDDKWDRRFLELAKHISSWSKDPSTKVGAVLVNPDTKIVVGIGYNGFARGVADTDRRLEDRDTKYKFVVHAEVNAILMAGERARGTTVYVYPALSDAERFPQMCNECCKIAIQAGINEVVSYIVPHDVVRWRDSHEFSRQMCEEAGVTYRGIKL